MPDYPKKKRLYSEDMFVPSEASVQMKSKVFNIFCLWERLIVDINRGAGFSAVGKGNVWIQIHLLSVAIGKASDEWRRGWFVVFERRQPRLGLWLRLLYHQQMLLW
jgi:hypothetical protein